MNFQNSSKSGHPSDVGLISAYARVVECTLDQFRDFIFVARESLFGKMNVIYELKSGVFVPIFAQR